MFDGDSTTELLLMFLILPTLMGEHSHGDSGGMDIMPLLLLLMLGGESLFGSGAGEGSGI